MCRLAIIVLIIFSFVVSPLNGSRILVVAPTPSYSHQIVFQPIWKELSLRGHKVVVITTDPLKDKTLTNLTEIDLSETYSVWKHINMVDIAGKSMGEMFEHFLSTFIDVSIYQLSNSDIQGLITDKTQHFDLALIEPVFPYALAFPVHFKCPYIMISSLDVPNMVHEFVGSPTNPILYPDFWTPYVGKMSILERMWSIYYSVYVKYFSYMKTFPLTQQLIDKYFGSSFPSLYDIYKNVSMIFVNTEPIIHPIRALVPAVIPIGGGMHLKSSKPLPVELQKRLDDATEGFIYFSLGSNVKSKHLQENTRRLILETFAELPYKIMWKFELDELEGKPDNVFISKWFPQQEIFGHPNIKLFITQGGLQSMEEAIYNTIPIVVMPFFGDQPFNAKLMVDKGIALSVDYNTLTKSVFKDTILEVIHNPKYRKNVEKLSFLVQDQQTTGLERAVWWTEYVLRHKGAHHLRGPAVNVPLYQQYLLDIIGAFFLVFIISIVLLLVVIKSLIKIIRYLIPGKKRKTN